MLSQAKEFLARNKARFYDDATSGSAFADALAQGIAAGPCAVRFPDNSVLTVDPLGCSVSATEAA